MMDYKRELEDLVVIVTREGASDLHLTAGRHPTIRVSGDLIPIVKKPLLNPEDTLGMVMEALSEKNREVFLANKDIDFSYSVPGGVRFRGNAFYQKGAVGAAFRLIPSKIKTIQELGLPDRLAEFARREQGFFLIVGP
ncbi:MAG: type IV pili twitching motility protein PilT, partial [Patescibacteria group bacterium]